jgi:hypothetical protein
MTIYCVACGLECKDGWVGLNSMAHAHKLHHDCYKGFMIEMQKVVHWQEHTGALALIEHLPPKKIKKVAKFPKKWHWLMVGFCVVWAITCLIRG